MMDFSHNSSLHESPANVMLKSTINRTANGKPQTATRGLPFPVNAMLKVSNDILWFEFEFIVQFEGFTRERMRDKGGQAR